MAAKTTEKQPKKLAPLAITVARRKITRKTTDPNRCARNRRPALEKIAKRMRVLNAENVARVRTAVQMRGDGATWAELEAIGYFYAEIREISRLSPELDDLFNTAEKLFRGAIAAKIESKIIDQAINPAKIPVIGWADGEANFARHPETNELICKERDNTNVLLAAARAFHGDFKEEAKCGNIGQQIVYNITVGGKQPETLAYKANVIDAQEVIPDGSRDNNP